MGIQAEGRVGHQLDKFGGLTQGRARLRSGVRTSGFSGAALARRPDKCNARRGYLVRPEEVHRSYDRGEPAVGYK